MCIYCCEKYSDYAIRYARSEGKDGNADSQEAQRFSRKMLNYETDPSYDKDCSDGQGIFTKAYDELFNQDQLEFENLIEQLAPPLQYLKESPIERKTGCNPEGTSHKFVKYNGLGFQDPEEFCEKCGLVRK